VPLGHLDPAELVSGAQARLSALGLYRGPIDGRLRARTRAALAAFQRAHDLEATGTLDEPTAARLAEAHGH
jgi:peptidoglycan hydrolase-like protein with peptidoglycan-binding domain